MGWTHYISIEPVSFDCLYKEAFSEFLKNCLIDQNILKNIIRTNKYYRFHIDTYGDNDKIKLPNGKYSVNNDGSYFLKSKFLKNKSFKQALINYYKSNGIFIKGPDEYIKSDGEKTGKWIVELVPSFVRKNENF